MPFLPIFAAGTPADTTPAGQSLAGLGVRSFRAAAAAYMIAVAPMPPADPLVAPSMPDRGSRWLPLATYAAITPGPVDAGLPQPVVSPELPDLARQPARAGATAYAAEVSATGLEPIVWPAYDQFTDASGTTLASHVPDTGGTWKLHPSVTGEFVITDANRVRTNSTTELAYYHSALPPSADYEVSCDLTCFTNPATDAPGVAGRIQLGAKTWYFARYRSTIGFQLFKVIAGTSTQLGVTYARILSAGEKPHLVLRMVGTAISLLVDGVVQVGPITDSSITLAGFAGIYDATALVDTNSTATHIDNYGADTNPPTVRRTTAPDYARPPVPIAAYLWSTFTPLDVIAPANPNVVPLFPDAARGARLPLANYAVQVSSPEDAGTVPAWLAIPDAARGARLPLANYAVQVTPPGDAGTVPAWVSTPDSARGPRLPLANFATQVAPPPDAGTLPAWLLIPDRAPGPRLPLANYAIFDIGPVDAGLAQPVIEPTYPDRAAAAWPRLANYATQTPPPHDAGLAQPIIFAITPDRAAMAQRTAWLAYAIMQPAPGDAGIVFASPSVAPSMPDRIVPRPTQAPYSLVVAAPRDAGLSAISSEYQDLARAPSPRPASFTLLIGTPPDAGLQPIPLTVADFARPFPPRRASFTLLVAAPSDAGTQPASVCLPRHASGQTNRAALDLLVAAPRDAGVVIVSAAVAPAMPDRVVPRPAQAAYSLTVAAPRDAGLLPIPPQWPDRASAKLNPATYSLFAPSPGDTGVILTPSGVAPSLPHRPSSSPRAAATAYTLLTSAVPHDAGLAQPVVQPVTPDRAATAQRTARQVYAIVVPSPGDAGIILATAAPLPATPDRVPPRLAQTYYSLTVAAPRDAGLLPVPLAVTDLARTAAPRPASFTLLVAAPSDAGTVPLTILPPDHASAPRLPLANFAVQVPPPHDAGTLPPRDLWPDRAPVHRRAGATAYHAELITTPRDAGLLQPIIPAVSPWRAPGPQWAAQSNYIALVSPSPPTPADLQVYPNPFGGTIAASSADPFSSTIAAPPADPFGATISSSTVDPFGATVKLKGS